MRQPTIEPIETPRAPPSSGTTIRHPAFGQIRAARISGSARLYGSDFEHQQFISIAISESELNRDLSSDWPFARGELIEVHLSEAQWAKFVSDMNGTGETRCTINHVMREYRPRIAPPATPKQQFAREHAENSAELIDWIAKAQAAMQDTEMTPGQRKKAVLDALHQARMCAGSSREFLADQFDRHMETTVQHAAIEINAMMTAAVRHAGLDAIAARSLALPGATLEIPNEITSPRPPGISE